MMPDHELGKPLPALFLGHGNPMNAITANPFRELWQALGAELPRPRAILCISAHWETPHTEVCGAAAPRTIHDFYGFPPELYAQRYPAPGAPALAQRVRELAGPERVTVTEDWGLDHGAWTLLASLFPAADVPVCQLSLGRDLLPEAHFELARSLAPLRQEGVLLLCSGNVVHNLRYLADEAPPDWAREFDAYVAQALAAGDHAALVDWRRAGPCARLAVPTAEHYLPLIYLAGVRREADRLRFVSEFFDLASLSMRGAILET